MREASVERVGRRVRRQEQGRPCRLWGRVGIYVTGLLQHFRQHDMNRFGFKYDSSGCHVLCQECFIGEQERKRHQKMVILDQAGEDGGLT